MNFKRDQPGAYVNQMLQLEKYQNKPAELYYEAYLLFWANLYISIKVNIQKQTKEIEHYVLVRSNNSNED